MAGGVQVTKVDEHILGLVAESRREVDSSTRRALRRPPQARVGQFMHVGDIMSRWSQGEL